VHIAELPAAQLVRLVVETPNIQDRLYRCAECRAEALWLGAPAEDAPRCSECREPTAPLGAAWWARASDRVRAACRRDRRLLGQVKAEWRSQHGDVLLPPLAEPFAWINRLWASTRAPGRPLDSVGHFTLAHTVGRLQSAGLSLNQIFEIARLPDLEARRHAALTLPESARRFVGNDLDGILAHMPRVSDRMEFNRRLRWALRQWSDAAARLRGERVRSRQH
jgi:hypothetical protein